MKLYRVRSVELEQRKSRAIENVDVFLAASGFEERCTHVASTLSFPDACVKIAFGFSSYRDHPVRVTSDAFFRSTLWKDLVERNDPSTIVEQVRESIEAGRSHVLVDISSMPRAWYGAIVREIRETKSTRPITVDFAYSRPLWADEVVKTIRHNIEVAPVPGFSSLELPAKPPALILGIGTDMDAAEGLRDYVDPAMSMFCLPTSSGDSAFDALLAQRMSKLEHLNGSSRIVRYPVGDPSTSYAMLESTVIGLKRECSVVLASVGPRVFGLVCFFLATKHEDVSVWTVSTGDGGTPISKKAHGEIVIARSEWIPD